MNKIEELLILHHNHIDVGYTHAQEVFWELSDRFIDEALDLCEAHSEGPEASRMHWTVEVTAPMLHWLRRATPDRLDQLKTLTKRGQLSFGALFCNMTALSNTEELIESLQPVRMLREELGIPVTVAVNHDVNGLSWSLAGLLHDLGIENLLMGINVHMGGYPLERPRAFFWEDPSGRRLLVFNGEHYNMLSRVMRRRETEDLSEMATGVEHYVRQLEAGGYPYDVALLSATHPAFNDNNPPDKELPELIRRWNEAGQTPPMRMAGPQELFDRLRSRFLNDIPVHRGDWVDYWTSGCASSAVEVAVNRKARSFYFASRALQALGTGNAKSRSGGTTETSRAHGDGHPTVRQRDRQVLSPQSNRSGTNGDQTRDRPSAALSERAWWHLAMGNEHTWGAFGSTGTFCPTQTVEPVPVNEQWSMKTDTIYKAHALSHMAMRDALEQAAGNPTQGRGLQGILVFNPLPVHKTGQVLIPREVLEKPWFHISSVVHQIETLQAYATPENAFVSEPYTLGPFEQKYIPLKALCSSPWQTVTKPAVQEPRAWEQPHKGAKSGVSEAPESGRSDTPGEMDQSAKPPESGRSGTPGEMHQSATSGENGQSTVPHTTSHAAQTADSGHSETNTLLENRWYRMKMDPDTGHLTSLFDKEGAQELLDPSSPWHFFEPVREYLARATPEAMARRDPRESFYEIDFERWHAGEDLWNRNWERAYDRPVLKGCDSGIHGEGLWFRRVWDGPGPEQITQSITLLHAEKRVRCEASFHKRDEVWPESLYMAFPLQVPDGRVHYDSGATATQYGRDVLPGGCLDWFTANSWVAAHNDSLAVVLAAPDAPLFMAGGWNYGRRLTSVPEGHASLLLGWVMNNYWNTNFRVSQPGPVRLRYELGSFERFDSAQCADFGRSAMLPLQWHPVLSCPEKEERSIPQLQIRPAPANGDAPDGRLASGGAEHRQAPVTASPLQVLSVGPSQDAAGVVLRLYLPADAEEQSYAVQFPAHTTSEAWQCSLLGEPLAPLSIDKNGICIHPKPGRVTHVLAHIHPA